MANKKKKSFMFYYDYAEYFELLDDHEARILSVEAVTYMVLFTSDTVTFSSEYSSTTVALSTRS